VTVVHHYFAFGSNMNPERVRERGLAVIEVLAARLSDHALVFDKRAADHPGSAHANVVRAPGEVVEGVLYRLRSVDEILKMDVFERAPVNYSREVVHVHTDAGAVPAWTYYANAAVRMADGRPERAYLAHLLAGEAFLSRDYHARLAAWPVADGGGASRADGGGASRGDGGGA
jgi:gamma-glutamylcyclotransferase (GGCT)/AIG2-like uncharacterized protein YtfP